MRIKHILDGMGWFPAWRVGDGDPPEWIKDAKEKGWVLDGPRGSLLVYVPPDLYVIARPGQIVFLFQPIPDHRIRFTEDNQRHVDVAYIPEHWEIDETDEVPA